MNKPLSILKSEYSDTKVVAFRLLWNLFQKIETEADKIRHNDIVEDIQNLVSSENSALLIDNIANIVISLGIKNNGQTQKS
jgi:hypothetical protein